MQNGVPERTPEPVALSATKRRIRGGCNEANVADTALALPNSALPDQDGAACGGAKCRAAGGTSGAVLARPGPPGVVSCRSAGITLLHGLPGETTHLVKRCVISLDEANLRMS